MPVRIAFVHEAHHFVPEPTRLQAAALKGCIFAPVGRVKLKGGAFHAYEFLLIALFDFNPIFAAC